MFFSKQWAVMVISHLQFIEFVSDSTCNVACAKKGFIYHFVMKSGMEAFSLFTGGYNCLSGNLPKMVGI